MDILFLDDLGKGNWTENTEAISFVLVEIRTSNGRPLIVTTNYKAKTSKKTRAARQLLPLPTNRAKIGLRST